MRTNPMCWVCGSIVDLKHEVYNVLRCDDCQEEYTICNTEKRLIKPMDSSPIIRLNSDVGYNRISSQECVYCGINILNDNDCNCTL